MATRCKFYCSSKREYVGWGNPGPKQPLFYEYEFNVVHDNTGENQAFFASTPAGNIKVSVVRDGTFEVGKAYYLDFSLANRG